MIKMIFVIMISIIVSACTTVLLMMRYSSTIVSEPVMDIKTVQVMANGIAVAPEAESTCDIDLHAIGQNDKVTTVDLKSSDEIRYFDYNKLNSDLDRISMALERFNKLLSKEVQRLKGIKESFKAPIGES